MDTSAPLSGDAPPPARATLLLSALDAAGDASFNDWDSDRASQPSAGSSFRRAAIPSAVSAAFDLAEQPALARAMRRAPLPTGVLTVIQIAAGCPETLRRLVVATRKDPAFIRAAAIVYIERVLWSSEGDHYRALGVARDARPRELAQHLLWFAKWVSEEWGWRELEAAFGERVLKAWNALKTAELRRRYDGSPLPRSPGDQGRRARVVTLEERVPWNATTLRVHPPLTLEVSHAPPWQLAAVGAALIAVAAIATVNWIVFQLPASASAPSFATVVSEDQRTRDLTRLEVRADGSRHVKTYSIRAKDDSRLVPASDE